jgi:preprotein translocase subunit SecF
MSLVGRLYRGETNIDFVGYRKRWYIASAVLLLICVGSLVFRGFNLGIEFAGGHQFLVPATASVSLEQVRDAAAGTGAHISSATVRGQAPQRSYVVRTGELSPDQPPKVVAAIARAAGVAPSEVASSQVSSSWGRTVTEKALLALAVFLVVVSIYIWIRFEQKMAIAAIGALAHDLLLTAGAYSIIGFEVTPATIIGLLTILGFSLYDTVVVFDKVEENTRGILGHSRYTYAEASNLAVNQTLMRSINTSLIALLPVGGLLFVGAGLLGVGTLKDLALVLFVGMLTGAYSSLFLATPWLVDLKLMDNRFKLHTQRVLARRTAAEKEAAERPAPATPAAAAVRAGRGGGTAVAVQEPATAGDGMARTAPRAGARPGQGGRKRPSGKRR